MCLLYSKDPKEVGKLTQKIKNMEPIYDSDMRIYLHAELSVCCQCIFFLILLVTNQLALLLWLGERFLLLKRTPECFYDYISVSSACDVCIRMSHMASLTKLLTKLAVYPVAVQLSSQCSRMTINISSRLKINCSKGSL